MSKGKNMDCVHKCVYNRSLEFEEEEEEEEKKTKNPPNKQNENTHIIIIMFFKYTTRTCTHTRTRTLVRTHNTHYLLKTYIIIVRKTNISLYTIYHVNNR